MMEIGYEKYYDFLSCQWQCQCCCWRGEEGWGVFCGHYRDSEEDLLTESISPAIFIRFCLMGVRGVGGGERGQCDNMLVVKRVTGSLASTGKRWFVQEKTVVLVY